MTSEEKLRLLYLNGVLHNDDPNFIIEQTSYLEDLIKELEILEILKNESDSKRIIERGGIISFHLDMILTIDNYNKIKEWLEK